MKKIVIDEIKNISHLEFNIPAPGLHIITGTNGIGKTTLFTCISRICNSNAYRVGFSASKVNNYDLFTGSITYQLDDKSVKYYRRSNGEWRPNNQSTTLHDFGYPSIINITTKDERVFSQQEIRPRSRRTADNWLNTTLNDILNTSRFTNMFQITTGDLRRGRSASSSDRRRNIAHIIPLPDNKFYTEQNFSFGEIVLLNLLLDVKNAVNGSILLIDELELALHPSAQIKLITVLKNIALEKGLTIIISTHSSSIIKAQKDVILLEESEDNSIHVIYNCPPAKAIGAIGMREDSMPDIIVLVEDKMAKSLFYALLQKYNELNGESNYLDIRILEIGGFHNVINFYNEANNYVFYDNVYLAAFMDKDVETDVIPYPEYGNREYIEIFNRNSRFLHFLPYTPEVLLVKMLYQQKNQIITSMRMIYCNQQINYSLTEELDFTTYFQEFPEFSNQSQYNGFMETRGSFRKTCKKVAEKIVEDLSSQINQSKEEIYRLIFKISVNQLEGNDINTRALLSSTLKRIN